MNRFISAIITIQFLSSSIAINAQQQPFVITGKITTPEAKDKVFLQYYYNAKSVKDSSIITDGTFEFKGNIDNPLKAKISIPSLGKSGSTVDFFIEPNQTIAFNASGMLKNATIDGGPVQNDYKLLKEMTADHDEKYAVLIDEYTRLREAKDAEGVKNLDARFDELSKVKKQILKTFVTQKPNSFVSFSSVLDISYMIDDEFLHLYNLLATNFKETKNGKELSSQIEKA